MVKKKSKSKKSNWFFVLAIIIATSVFYVYLSQSIAETVKTEIKIHFLRGEGLTAVKRGISLQSSASDIGKSENALMHLIKGPKTTEKILGIYSEIPSDIKVLSVRQEGRVIKVNLSSEFLEYGGGSSHIHAAIAQIVYTLTELKSIHSVKFLINGKEGALIVGGEGYVIEKALSRSDINL